MTFRTLIRRSLRFHWRAHLGVVLGAAVGSAALIGALVVGDSVKLSLRSKAIGRLANASVALNSGERFFQADLLDRLLAIGSNQVHIAMLSGATNRDVMWGGFFTLMDSRAILQLPASVSRQDGVWRANHAQLLGVSDSELQFMRTGRPVFPGEKANAPPEGEAWVNDALAQQLSVKAGDELLFRIQKPSALSSDATISTRNDSTVVMRLRVAGIAKSPLSNLSLVSGITTPLNALISRAELGAMVHLDNRANVLLAGAAYHIKKHNPLESFRFAYRFSRDGQGSSPFESLNWWSNRGIKGIPATSEDTIGAINPILTQVWTLQDIQHNLSLRPTPQPSEVSKSFESSIEMRTPRIFLDPPVVRAALAADANAQLILTYLVNLLRAGTNTTPYSMITAAGPPWTLLDMRDDEVVVSQWLAEDLQVKPGEEIAMSYFLPESGARLEEGTNRFRIRGIVPMEMPWADRTLMPDFPGIEKAESTSDWDAGFPLVHKIRQKDEDYWKKYRGTPKAFITLAAGQKMWANRFGDLTAIRFPIPTNAPIPLTPALSPSEGERENRRQSVSESGAVGDFTNRALLSPLPVGRGEGRGEGNSVELFRAALEKKILASLKPEELGLRFEPVREQALKAAEQSQDFGQLFLGFSFFLIAAALLLMAMLFQFGLEQRMAEIGTLLALGFKPNQVRWLLLGEGTALAFVGGVLGALAGVAYAQAMLHGLTTIWRDAVGASALSFHATPQTLVIGLGASTAVSAVTIWVALRKFVRRPAIQLLVGEIHRPPSTVRGRGRAIGFGALAAAFGLVAWTLAKGDAANAGAFFGAGALVLAAGLSFASAWLGGMERRSPTRRASAAPSFGQRAGSEAGAPITLVSLGVRGCARRRKRSLATVAMLACGSFLIVSIGVFRLDANRDATKRSSGTGGFALVGESTMPVVQDLNSQSGRDFFALNERDLAGVSFVPFRVREGDEASCLNLNRAQKPRLLGVKPEMLEGRFTFAKGAPWAVMRTDVGQASRLSPSKQAKAKLETGATPVLRDEIPAIGDANSIQWAMHKKVGDTIDYVDERGQPFKVRIVGAVANSIMQGSLIIDEAEFVKRFPSESGYRMFLIDAPSNSMSQVSATLSRAMQDVGLELTPAAQRLAQFNAVQNTYLGTFQVLGGLGLLLGSVGLGIVVLRNVLERRGELAVLLAVGFRTRVLQRLVLIEHGALLVLGLAVGIVAAAVAVLPALLSPAAQLPYASLALTLGAVLINGALWTWVATRVALRGNLLNALRNE